MRDCPLGNWVGCCHGVGGKKGKKIEGNPNNPNFGFRREKVARAALISLPRQNPPYLLQTRREIGVAGARTRPRARRLSTHQSQSPRASPRPPPHPPPGARARSERATGLRRRRRRRRRQTPQGALPRPLRPCGPPPLLPVNSSWFLGFGRMMVRPTKCRGRSPGFWSRCVCACVCSESLGALLPFG